MVLGKAGGRCFPYRPSPRQILLWHNRLRYNALKSLSRPLHDVRCSLHWNSGTRKRVNNLGRWYVSRIANQSWIIILRRMIPRSLVGPVEASDRSSSDRVSTLHLKYRSGFLNFCRYSDKRLEQGQGRHGTIPSSANRSHLSSIFGLGSPPDLS